MADTKKTNTEGGTDFEGLQDFIVDVNTEGFETQTDDNDIVIDTGEEKNKEEGDDNKDPKDPTEKSEEKKEDGDDSKSEEKSEEKNEEPKKEETPEVDQSDSYYGKLAQKFLNKGKWQDAEIETEDGTVKLSELDKIDEDTFFAIEESQSKFNEEEIKNNYIKKGDFDENKLKVIEILKEGGDIKDIFETPEDAKRPFEGVDLEDENIQKTVFFNYLTQVQRMKQEDAKVIVGNHINRGEIEDRVKEIVGGYQKQYDDKLSEKLETIKKEKEERKQKDKEFSKSLEEVYKNFNLDSKLAKKLSQLGTKRTDDGDFELDSIYSSKLDNPEEAAELIYFLNDKEGYLKDKMSETKIKTEQSHLKKINLIKSKEKKESGGNSEPRDGRSEFIIDVNE